MTHILFLITAYLFVGSLVMLLVNELTYGAITEKEFLRGMALWPGLAVFCVLLILLAYVRRIRKALSRG